MKSKIYMAMIVALVVTAAGYNMYSTRSVTKLSDLALANVEALADNSESGSDKGTLYGNSEGTRFCCCSGTNSCSAAKCANCS